MFDLETILLDSYNIHGNIPKELYDCHNFGHIQKLFVDCERGKIIQCECCECSGDDQTNSSNANNWTYNQKKTWSKLASLLGDKLLNQYSSAQYKVARWIVDEEDNWHDPVEMTDFIYQQYVLVLYYFMMGKQSQFKLELKVEDECQWERILYK